MKSLEGDTVEFRLYSEKYKEPQMFLKSIFHDEFYVLERQIWHHEDELK